MQLLDPALSDDGLAPDAELSLDAMMARNGLVKQTVDEWLNQVDYGELNAGHFRPGSFALKMLNFIKLVNGAEGEEHKTPVVHLAMLDRIEGTKSQIVNLCHRGAAKTTLMAEYLFLYIAVFGEIDGFGAVDFALFVGDTMENGAKNLRKNVEHRYTNSAWLQEWVPEAVFTDALITFKNRDGRQFAIKLYGAKTGIRGAKHFGKRPQLCILDDLVSDEDAHSKAALTAIKNTIHKGVKAAMHPTKKKIVFNGTPFNKGDPIYEAVESGAWHVNVWPVCETFPCTRAEFRGSWPDRFTYDSVLENYQSAVLEGTVAAFMQEYMLRISSDEERLVLDAEIRWFSRMQLLERKSQFNFYITTDFATRGKTTNDYSVISVWAYNANADWFWVDGICRKQTMDKNIDDLFRLVQQYGPQSVAIEVSGQQGAFIQWIQGEMMNRNIWFNFAQGKNNQPGIQPDTDKLSRFNIVLPWFKSGKMYFPSELKGGPVMAEFISELTLASVSGFKSKHDDCLDTISQLAYLKAWKPSEASPMTQTDNRWEMDDEFDQHSSPISSYVV